MKFKLDENLGRRCQELFQAAGHDVHTVYDEGLQGATDEVLYKHCCAERRCLITLDLDFADVVRFPSERSAGLVVLRPQRNFTLSVLETLIRHFLQALSTASPVGQLWIVEVGRIRVHQTDNNSS